MTLPIIEQQKPPACQASQEEARREKIKAIITAYKMGGTPIPVRGKIPIIKGWPSLVWDSKAFMHQLVDKDCGVGMVLTDKVHCLDFDSEDDYLAFLIDHPDVEKFPTVRTPRGYRVFFRPKEPLRKQKIDGDNTPEYEVLGIGSQGVLPPSIHPDTGTPYQWEIPFTGEVPTFDLAEWHTQGKAISRAKTFAPLTPDQRRKVEDTLVKYLPGARRINGEIAGYLDLESKSRAHVKVNLSKGVYMDWRKGEGGTIKELLRRIGAPIPPELGGMGEGKIPEYFPIWAIDRHWGKRGWKCGEIVSLVTKDNAPIWVGRAFCLRWGCPECALRLTNILKARISKIPNITVWKSPPGAQKILARIKRHAKDFEYARAKNGDSEYLLARDADGISHELAALGFQRSQYAPRDIIDGLPHAPVERRQKRHIASKRFWRVGDNILTLHRGRNTCPAEQKKQGIEWSQEFRDYITQKHKQYTDYAPSQESILNNANIRIYAIDADLCDVLRKLHALGFGTVDVGEGESYKVEGFAEVDPHTLGHVVEVVFIKARPP